MRASNTWLSRKAAPRPSANRTWWVTTLAASTYIVGCTYGTMLTVEPRGSPRRPSESPTGMISCDAPLTKFPPHADDHRTIQREVDRVRDDALPRLGAEQQLGVAGPGRREKTGLEAQVESVTGDAIGPFERRAAAVGEAQRYADLGAHERAIR